MMNSSGSGWKNGLGGPQPQPPQKKMADVDVSKTGSPSSSYPPGGGQDSQAGGPHYFARGSGVRQAVSLPTTSPLGFLRSAGKASGSTASLKPSAAQRMAGIESERGMRPPPAVEVRDMAAAGVRNSSRVLRRVESEQMMAVDDEDSVASLQSSSSSTELGHDDDVVGRRSVDAQLARNMLDTQLNDQFHTQKKNSLAYISFFKNAQKYSESLQESAEYGAEMSRAMIKMAKTAPNSEEDSEIIESMSVSWGGMMQLQQHCLRPLFTEDEFAEKFQLYDGVAEVVSLEKEYKKQHAVYTQRLKKYEKSIRKERTKKAKQNSATLVSDSIDMQLLQTSFDEWRAQMMEDLTEMERVRQARFACLFWQNLERQLEHYRTFISLLEKEKNSWEARYRAVASTTPTAPAPAPSIAPTPAPTATTNTNPDTTPKSKEVQVRESRKGRHHSAGEVTHARSASRLSSSPLLSSGDVTRSATSPPHPKGVSFEARNDTDSEPLTSDSEGPDPFVEEVDHLLQGELDERQRKVTISAAVAQHKIKRPNSKRQSTIALASQLLDWCFQTDASMTAMPITRKTPASISEGVVNNENENENEDDKDNENGGGSRVDNDRDFEKEERNNDDGDGDDKQPNNNNNNNNKNNHSSHDSNRLNPNNAESEGEPPLERQRLHSAADILDSIFAVDPQPAVHAPATPAPTAAGASSPALQASSGGSGSATQYRPSIGNKSQRVSIGCRRRAPSPAAAATNDSGPGYGDKGGEHNKDS